MLLNYNDVDAQTLKLARRVAKRTYTPPETTTTDRDRMILQLASENSLCSNLRGRDGRCLRAYYFSNVCVGATVVKINRNYKLTNFPSAYPIFICHG